jgi:hypothetical protein
MESHQHQRLMFHSVDTNRTNTNNKRLEKCLKFTNTDTIEGNIIITSNKPYSQTKKNKDTKRLLQNTCTINIIYNKLNLINPTEIGFMIHHHARYDTANSIFFFTEHLPIDTPPFRP